MGHYTKFYFRAKLCFETPPVVLDLLERQFDQNKEIAGQWEGWRNLPRDLQSDFFEQERACCIPWCGQSTKGKFERFVRHADGGATIEFLCEFKNYGSEIEKFLEWIKPWVRLRYAKRNRGRKQVWVGWQRSESADRHYNIFIKPVERTDAASFGYFPGNLFDREVEAYGYSH